MEKSRSAWPQVRAGLVAFHLVSVVVLSLPQSATIANRRAWETPNTKAEFRHWAQRFTAVGLDVTPAEFEARLWTVASTFGRARDEAGKPFQIYADLIGGGQGWQMFAAPQKYPAELHVDVEVEGEWRALVRPRDPRSNWRRWQRTHNRFRKMLGRFARTFYESRYDGVAHWVATRAAHDFPETTRIRVRLWRFHSLPPRAVAAGDEAEGHYQHERLFAAAPLRSDPSPESPQ